MKKIRHNQILDIITKYDIETQEELASHLKNAGFLVTQATVSRDIRELKLTKAEIRRIETGRCPYGGPFYQSIEGWFCIHGYGAEYFGSPYRIRYGHGCGCSYRCA